MVTLLIGSKTGIFHLNNTTWKCSTELRSDVLIEVKEFLFFLHKFPLINASPFLRNLIGKYSSEEDNVCNFSLHEIPGGAQSFELIAKFCYGEKFELTSTNVVAVLCAAHHLGMHEDYMAGNLISQAEDFLFKKVLLNWKASIAALLSCEHVGHCAEKLDIVSRCLEAISCKVRIGKLNHPPQRLAWNGLDGSDVALQKAEAPGSNWWHDDVSALSLPLFKRLIGLLGTTGHDPADISNSVISYWNKVQPGLNPNSTGVYLDNLKLSLEETVALLPVKKGVTPIKTLFNLLTAGLMYSASTECIESLEKRIGAQLDESTIEDLLGPDLEGTYEPRYAYSKKNESNYGIDFIQRIIEQFAEENVHGSENTVESEDESAKVAPVAKLIDEYLTKMARDPNLNFQQFKSLASAIPASARPLNDDLYRAIDVYFECHPSISEQQKEQLCQLVDIQKLSREACRDMAQNEKLPPRVLVRVLYSELLHLNIVSSGDEPETGGQRESERKDVVRQRRWQWQRQWQWQRLKKLQHCNRIVKKLINKVENAAAALPKTNWKPLFSRRIIRSKALPPIPSRGHYN